MKFLQVSLFICSIIIGEALAIWTECLAAKDPTSPRNLAYAFFWITIAGIPLIAGYAYGMHVLKSIWVVSVTSVTAVLIAEPILVWFVFKEIPTKGSVIGFVCGVIGFVATLTIK